IEDMDGIARTETAEETDESTYETAEAYIDSLNSDGQWVIYDSETNTASITSVEDFVKNCKTASKKLGSFDQLDRGQGENTLFGYNDGNGAHFDSIMAELLTGTEYEDDFAEDLSKTDSAGNTVDVRLNMYTPLYYISEAYDGYGTSDVAEYWRIRTGINQSDTALSTEVNLALALQNYGREVDFETVWAPAHVEAQRTGSS
ncbi:MAG: tannase, partial [Eubacterium sp.]|nr:tannase [Eubacterium sp.]